MSATLEDSADAPLVYAGHRALTSADFRSVHRLERILFGYDRCGKTKACKTMLGKKR